MRKSSAHAYIGFYFLFYSVEHSCCNSVTDSVQTTIIHLILAFTWGEKGELRLHA